MTLSDATGEERYSSAPTRPHRAAPDGFSTPMSTLGRSETSRRLPRLGLAGVRHLLDATITSGGGSILLTLGANLLVQSVVVQSKAHRQAEEYTSR
jgi:hypothetical protein